MVIKLYTLLFIYYFQKVLLHLFPGLKLRSSGQNENK